MKELAANRSELFFGRPDALFFHAEYLLKHHLRTQKPSADPMKIIVSIMTIVKKIVNNYHCTYCRRIKAPGCDIVGALCYFTGLQKMTITPIGTVRRSPRRPRGKRGCPRTSGNSHSYGIRNCGPFFQ